MLGNLIYADLQYHRSLLAKGWHCAQSQGSVLTESTIVSPSAPWERPLSHDKQDFLLFQALVFPLPSSAGGL